MAAGKRRRAWRLFQVAFWLALLALVSCEPAGRVPAAGDGWSRSEAESVRVARVSDGDTVLLGDGRTVRYLGLDAPELGEPGYGEALEVNRRLLARGPVFLRAPAGRRDSYGRVLGVLAAGPAGGRTVNVELVAQGLAWVYQRGEGAVPDNLLAALLDAQGSALRERRGIWRRVDRFSRETPHLRATRFRIHRAGCRHLRQGRPRPVRSLLEELLQGRSPCRSCRPFP